MGRIVGRLFSQQPFARNCEKYANDKRHSAKMRMNALLSVRVECLRFKKVKAKKSLDFNIFFGIKFPEPVEGLGDSSLIDYRASHDSVVRVQHQHLSRCRCKLRFIKSHADLAGGGIEFRNSCRSAFMPEADVGRERFLQ